MHSSLQSRAALKPTLSFVLLASLITVLWFAGGASRADAMGQVVVRGAAVLALAGAIMFGRRPSSTIKGPVAWFLLASVALALLQLIPLPPTVWQSLPGRELLATAADVSGQPQPWRPLSIVPGATINAAGSLLVPISVLLLISQLPKNERAWLPGCALLVVTGSTLVGVFQFTGVRFNNPFINDEIGEVSGTFANRNHFALLLAYGCALAPVWALRDRRFAGWRGLVALGLVLLFALMILASGSRAGLVLGILGLGLGLMLSWTGIREALLRYPRWVLPAFIGGAVALILALVLISVAADRAVSISRVLSLDTGGDMRRQALPTILEMIRIYFPVGSGLGTFDPIFRIHEPFELLTTSYFNHAHNDLLEVILDSGLAGALLFASAIIWGALAGVRAWRSGASQLRPRLGSIMLLLTLVASLVDYPARTPLILALLVMAAVWLGEPGEDRLQPALPMPRQSL